MITEQDINAAIAECQGQRNPDANTCVKLAAFYTIKREMFGTPEQEPSAVPAYSFAAPPAEPAENPTIDYSSGTEFSRAIDGKDVESVLTIMDDAMSIMQNVLPKAYDNIIRRLSAL